MILKDLYLHDSVSNWLKRGDLEITGEQISALNGVGSGQTDDRFRGRFLMPAFFDAHTHFSDGGRYQSQLNLNPVRNAGELLQQIRERAIAVPPGQWIRGYGLNPGMAAKVWSQLHQITQQHFLYLDTHDLHSVFTNVTTLEKAGVMADTSNPDGGRLQRSPNGELTGLLSENAIGLIRRLLPEPDDHEIAQGILQATTLAHRLGITGVAENADLQVSQVYRRMNREHGLQMDVDLWYRLNNGDPAVFEYEQFAEGKLTAHAVKLFMDGAFGSKTAALSLPYRNGTDRGVTVLPDEQVLAFVQEGVRKNWQLVIHAIGDVAVETALDALEAAFQSVGAGRGRHRIEHLQILPPRWVKRFRADRILPSLQPLHLLNDMAALPVLLPDALLEDTYRWRELLDRDIITPLGTDWPVEPLDPLINLWAASTRTHPVNGNVFGRRHRYSVNRALRGLTWDAAWGSFREGERGRLLPGWNADLVVLSHNPYTMDLSEYETLKVLATFHRGELVYLADELATA